MRYIDKSMPCEAFSDYVAKAMPYDLKMNLYN